MIGRGREVAWLEERLAGELSPGLILFSGAPGIGKTTLLRALRDQFPTRRTAAFFVDAAKLSYGSWSGFLWSLSQAVTIGLHRTGLDAPAVEKRQFVIRPQATFVNAFWQPLLIAHGGWRLALLIDHADAFLERQVDRLYGRELRTFIGELLGQGDDVAAILTTALRWESLSKEDLAPLMMSEAFTLGPLPPAEAAALVDETVDAAVPRAVHDYVYRLSRGHPADVAALAEALQRRVRRWDLAVLSHADVLAVLAAELQPAVFYTPVYARRASVQVELARPLA